MDRTNISIDEFSKMVKEHLFDNKPGMADTHTADINEVMKNNGMLLHGLTMRGNDEHIAPTIYLEKFFDEFKDGKALSEIVDKILDIYEEHKAPKNICVDFFTDFNQAKDRLAMKVVNAEKNAEMLANAPHYTFGDLAAIFQVQVDATEYGNAVITVKDEHMKMWGVKTEDLMNLAKENMAQNQPVRIQGMMEVLREMMGDVPAEMLPTGEDQMYVMSNETKINGAAAVIFTEKLDEFAKDKNADLFIIPSSIHECIIVPDTGNINAEDLGAMVKDVNSTQVAPDEVLSDNVYFYDREAKTLYITATNEPCVLESDGKDFSSKEKKRADKTSEKAAEKAESGSKSLKDRLADGKERSEGLMDAAKDIAREDKSCR